MSTSEVRQAGSGEAIRLFTMQDEEGQVSSVIPLRWCISRDTALMLQQRKIDDPQLLIAISNGGEEVDRYLVPLVAEMHYLQFRRPGNNTVHATIVWPMDDDKPLKKQLSARTDFGEYRMNVVGQFQPRVSELERRRSQLYGELSGVDDDREAVLRTEIDQVNAELRDLRESEPIEACFRPRFDAMHRLEYEAQLDVVVPEDMFAKEPPRWMKWLGNKYNWTRPARDQCDLRRRALFTASTLPLVYLAKLVGLVIVEAYNLVIAGTLLFFGFRELDFDPLRHPFQYSAKYIGRSKKPSIWWTKKTTEHGYTSYPRREPVFLVLNPPVIAAFLAVGVVLYLVLDSWVYIVQAVIVAVAVVLVVLISSLLSEPLLRKSREAREQREREEAERRARQREQLTRELELLACDGRSRTASVSALPKSRRTVHLRFYDLKAKVCKPFAR